MIPQCRNWMLTCIAAALCFITSLAVYGAKGFEAALLLGMLSLIAMVACGQVAIWHHDRHCA